MSDIAKIQIDIENLESKIQENEQRCAHLEGKLQSLKEQLKKDFDCDSLESAKKVVEEFKIELDKLKEERDHLTTELDGILDGSD